MDKCHTEAIFHPQNDGTLSNTNPNLNPNPKPDLTILTFFTKDISRHPNLKSPNPNCNPNPFSQQCGEIHGTIFKLRTSGRHIDAQARSHGLANIALPPITRRCAYKIFVARYTTLCM